MCARVAVAEGGVHWNAEAAEGFKARKTEKAQEVVEYKERRCAPCLQPAFPVFSVFLRSPLATSAFKNRHTWVATLEGMTDPSDAPATPGLSGSRS